MVRRLFCVLVFAAICLGAGAAGSPVAGDSSTAAITAGINLSTSVGAHSVPRMQAHPRDVVHRLDASRLQLTMLLLLLLTSSTAIADIERKGGRTVARRLDRARRGPPPLL